MNMRLIVSHLLICMVISGCASTYEQRVVKEPDPVVAKLERLAQVMAQHANRVAELQEANYQHVNGDALAHHRLDLLPHLTKVVSLGAQYTGPLDAFLERLSLQAGMNRPRYFRIPPPGNIIVSANTDYRSVLDILRDVGAQSGSRAVITYKASENLLEVEYAPL